ncbi:rhomboid family intramembrane serine protease [Weissella viridescens]|nr:rhomboid family intramembrane serine protease [Weissella viridescens]
MKNKEGWRARIQARPMTWFLTLLMIVIFLIEMLLSKSIQIKSLVLYQMGATYPPSIIDGQWWRLITAGFLHGSPLHLIGNMVVFVWLGEVIEGVLGSLAVGVLFLNSVIAGNLLSLWVDPWQTLSVGASGGIFGFFAAFIVFWLLARQPDQWQEQAKSMAVMFVLMIILSLMTPSVSVSGHVGGFIGGLLLTAGVMWRRPLQRIFKIKLWGICLSWLITISIYGTVVMLSLQRWGG